jgi:[DsrC]-trisulfide reductase subunit J
MRERLWILAGFALFLGAVTYPVWHSLEARTTAQPPALLLPKQEKQCVAPVSYMRTSHMKLLLDWRQSVVRDDQRRFVAFNGRVYDMNLTGTCLKCHEKKEFCDRCHTYAGVPTPYCWNCHVDPSLAQGSAR